MIRLVVLLGMLSSAGGVFAAEAKLQEGTFTYVVSENRPVVIIRAYDQTQKEQVERELRGGQ